MRIRVIVDITKPLLRVLNIEGLNQRTIQVTLAYEKLSDFLLLWSRRSPS